MASSFHESYDQKEIKPPSERSTGLTFAAVALIFTWLSRHSGLGVSLGLSMAGLLATVSLIRPDLLRPLNLLWFRFGLLLHRIVNPAVMLLMFAFVIVPAGLLMRIWHDPLRSKRAEPGASYWIEHQVGTDTPRSMVNQF